MSHSSSLVVGYPIATTRTNAKIGKGISETDDPVSATRGDDGVKEQEGVAEQNLFVSVGSLRPHTKMYTMVSAVSQVVAGIVARSNVHF